MSLLFHQSLQLPVDLLLLHLLAGTGIAPFRSFWRRIFYDGIPGQPTQPFSDNAMFWLLSGFANTDR